MTHLKLVGQDKEQTKEEKDTRVWPEAALDAINEFCKESEVLANLATKSVIGFVLCISTDTEDEVLIVGDKSDPDYLHVCLDDALFSLKFRKNITGEIFVDE